jgi:DNA-binding transcriptional LysR family regulator
MGDLLKLICYAVAGFRSRAALQTEVLALRHQLNVPRRRAPLDESWCLFDRQQFQLSVAKAFRAKGLEMPRRTMITNSVQLSFAMAATGNVLTVASASRLRLAGDRLGVTIRPIRLDLTLESFPTGIVTLKNRSISPAAQLFIECTRKLVRPLGQGN